MSCQSTLLPGLAPAKRETTGDLTFVRCPSSIALSISFLLAAPVVGMACSAVFRRCLSWLLPTLVVLSVGSVHAYSPDSPEVKRAVERAASFLEQGEDPRLGAKALAARVMLYLDKPSHPVIAKALQAVRDEIQGRGVEETRIYSVGIALAFLAEHEPQQNREEIQRLVEMLVTRQKPHGGWGYPYRPTGDTSMTQYAIYGLWNAAQAGVTVDNEVWTRAVNWLLRTQDPGGGWGYQGNDPADSGKLIAQSEIRRSMTEAALVTLYLGGEKFGLWKFRRDDPGISKLLKRVEVKTVAAAPPFDPLLYRNALDRGTRWDKNSHEPLYAEFPCYHLYTIERYHSFRDAALGTTDTPTWYDQGVEYLLKSQQPNGSWLMPEGPVAATSFAALFLMRTTQKAILKEEKIGAGTLVGGRGLPLPLTTGAVPSTTTAAPGAPRAGDELSTLTQKLQDPVFLTAIADVENRGPAADAPPPNELKQKLLALAKGDAPEDEAAALTGLGRTGDLDYVPLMIEAIRDPHPLVHQAAVDALRYLARRTDEFGKPLPTDAAARSAEATRWQEWYRLIRPPGR